MDEKLRLASSVFAEAQLPMLLRITRFSLPVALDAQLAQRGFTTLDDTRVMVRDASAAPAAQPAPEAPLPAGLHWKRLDPDRFAEAVGRLRDSPEPQRRAHAQRLALSPAPHRGHAICRADGAVLACGQYAREADLVGLYDVFTAASARQQGLATRLCECLLALSASEGAQTAYLQVESDNPVARRIYERLGFTKAYAYHYRQAPAATAAA